MYVVHYKTAHNSNTVVTFITFNLYISRMSRAKGRENVLLLLRGVKDWVQAI